MAEKLLCLMELLAGRELRGVSEHGSVSASSILG